MIYSLTDCNLVNRQTRAKFCNCPKQYRWRNKRFWNQTEKLYFQLFALSFLLRHFDNQELNGCFVIYHSSSSYESIYLTHLVDVN